MHADRGGGAFGRVGSGELTNARHAPWTTTRACVGLIDTEHPIGSSRTLRSLVAAGWLLGGATALAWLAGEPRLRRSRFVLGDVLLDRPLPDGEFDEFFSDHSKRLVRSSRSRIDTPTSAWPRGTVIRGC